MRWDVHYVERTGSTNRDLLARARAGAPAGTVLRAGHQTAGRGRLGRSWQAPPGSSLLASILLEADPVPFGTMARVSLAARDACFTLAGVAADLKWPNDLMVGERKLAGLLAESEGRSSLVVVGIGVNVAWPPREELPEDLGDLVAALSHQGGAVPTPAELLDALLDRLDGWLACTGEEVLAAYRSRCATLGAAVRVVLPDRVVEGRAVGLTPSGELEVDVAGTTVAVAVGDVRHVRAR